MDHNWVWPQSHEPTFNILRPLINLNKLNPFYILTSKWPTNWTLMVSHDWIWKIFNCLISFARIDLSAWNLLYKESVCQTTEYVSASLLLPCALLSKHNIAVLFDAKFVSTLTAATILPLKAMLSKAIWWPSPLIF